MNNFSILKNKKLALFFTRGFSLQKWEEKGLLERELSLYKFLSKFFNQILFFTYGGEEELLFQEKLPSNLKIVPNPGYSKNLYSFALPFVHRKILNQVDIVKTNQIDGSWTAVLSKKINKNLLVVRAGYLWSAFISQAKGNVFKKATVNLIENFSFKSADAIILTTQKDAETVHKSYHINQSLLNVIPNYVDTELFKPLPNENKERTRICFVGRLTPQKNLKELLKALEESPYTLDLVGAGEEEEELKKMVKSKRLKVNFLGRVTHNELPHIFSQCYIFALPSKYEGMPKALIEAMSSGLIVIASNISGIKEIIEDKKNGLLCEPEADSIRKAIDKVVHDPELAERLRKNARETVLQRFSLEKVAKKEVELYSKLLAKME